MTAATSAHTVTVTPVSRRTFDVAFVVHIVRCAGCGWKVEHRDAEHARRDALRHGVMRRGNPDGPRRPRPTKSSLGTIQSMEGPRQSRSDIPLRDLEKYASYKHDHEAKP